MKKALFYTKKGGKLQCTLCPKICTISKNKVGFCSVRKNIKNELFSLVYANPISVALDPIEKKPLYHFLPGTPSLSIGTVGCNLDCKQCQNWTIARGLPNQLPEYELQPEELIEKAIESGCKSIAYTYNEPTVFYEYVLDTAKLARKNGIKNVIVSNGFINEEPLKKWCKYIDAANIDLKGSDKFYKTTTTGWLGPVQNTLKILKKNNIWLEITNLIIPTLNDKEQDINDLCNWIKENIGGNVPLHFSSFRPCYKLTHLGTTPKETLIKAKSIAKKVGLNYIYIGNITTEKHNNTYCHKCNKLLIKRDCFKVQENNLKENKCTCKVTIPGKWNDKV
ncbi:MAG: AmmeMemoRadiSam system radical SAM enzyme [Candidatus Woesearchaeota archaeon]|nr:AmmeMemoRadiSam system radical SAM enzyme [Candidatus Woesearchaeota archaeon]